MCPFGYGMGMGTNVGAMLLPARHIPDCRGEWGDSSENRIVRNYNYFYQAGAHLTKMSVLSFKT
jgi:hypothetical protein